MHNKKPVYIIKEEDKYETAIRAVENKLKKRYKTKKNRKTRKLLYIQFKK